MEWEAKKNDIKVESVIVVLLSLLLFTWGRTEADASKTVNEQNRSGWPGFVGWKYRKDLTQTQ